MDKAVWKRVVVPTLITGAAFIGITTRGYDQFNFVTQLLKLKTSTGDTLFRNINIDLCCDHCRRIGREDTCRHKMGEMPYWHEAGMYKHIKQMFGDDEEAFLVETKGLEVETGILPAFDKLSLEKFFDTSSFIKEINYQKNVFIGIDPAAGGDRSKYAMVSAVYRDFSNDLVIIGAESSKFKQPWDAISLLVRHINAIRKIPGLETSNIILIPESNLAFEALWVSREMKKHGSLKNVHTMVEDHNRDGVRMNYDLKFDMANVFNEKLRNGTIKLFQNFITLGCGDGKMTPQIMKNDLLEQLKNYSRKIVPSNDPNKGPKEFYGGKEGYGYDDHAIAIQLVAIMVNKFRISNQYKHLQ